MAIAAAFSFGKQNTPVEMQQKVIFFKWFFSVNTHPAPLEILH